MELKETKINSVTSFIGLVSELQGMDSGVFFRGHADKEYELIPSVYRKPQWYSNEDKIIREIIMRCPSEFSSMKTSFDKLVKMQHYDLPTRLLDLTENPLISLYFACVGDDEKNNDGEVIMFKVPKPRVKYFDSDTVCVISNVAMSKGDFEIAEKFSKNYRAFHRKDNHHALKLLHDIKQEKPHFLERIDPNHIQSVICVKPKMDNPRVIRQEGAFLLFGINGNKHSPAVIPEEWLHTPNGKRFIVKSSDKVCILKQLASIGISKAKLFPEIDMVAQFIKNDFGLQNEEFRSSIKEYSPPRTTVMRL